VPRRMAGTSPAMTGKASADQGSLIRAVGMTRLTYKIHALTPDAYLTVLAEDRLGLQQTADLLASHRDDL
jgi:hypothetical protein